jgi:predicted TIM-barrel fold metal-dependent hydrolase
LIPPGYRLISGCSRLDIAPACWAGRIPLKWRERRPRRIQNGEEAVLIDQWPLHRIGASTNGEAYEEEINIAAVDSIWAACSPAQRVRAQDLDGLDAEIMFTDPYSPVFLGMVESQDRANAEMMCAHPIFAGFWRGAREDEGYRACIHAYNAFLAEDYCAPWRSRLIGIGVIPDTGVDDAIGEMENCARLGLRGVALHRFPSGRGYPTPEDDRFWRAAIGIDMPISFLPDRGRGTLRQAGRLFEYPLQQVDSLEKRDSVTLLPGFVGNHSIAPLQLAHAGVFDRFPQLQIYFAEWQPGWPPNPVARVDEDHEQKRYWGGRSQGIEPMAHPPSFYLKRHCLWSFLNDAHAVARRDDVGTPQLIWGSGLARATGDWPHPRNVIEGCFAGVSAEERHRMLAGNVIDFFHLQGEVRESERAAHAAAHAR